MDGRRSIPARGWQADVTQKKINHLGLGLAPLLLVTGIDGGHRDAEFLASPLNDLSVARVMEKMKLASNSDLTYYALKAGLIQ